MTVIFVVTFVGLVCFISGADRRPADMTISISYEQEGSFDKGLDLELDIVIQSISQRNIVYENKKIFRSVERSDRYELSLIFRLENINQPLQFIGKLSTIPTFAETKHVYTGNISYDVKNLRIIKGLLGIPKTLHSASLPFHPMDIIVRVKCENHYYPENVCNKSCDITQNVERCDDNGYKICRKEYYLNVNNQNCERNWCRRHECLNGGSCVNMAEKYRCDCTLSYQGDKCEIFIDACLRFLCPNGTMCLVKNEKINCNKIPKIQDPSTLTIVEASTISLMTMTVVAASVAVVAIGFCVTIWACKGPKFRKYESEESVICKRSSYRHNIDSDSSKISAQMLQPDYMHCTCKWTNRQSDWTCANNDIYHSLRYPNGHVCCRPKRTNSDIYISRTNGRLSVVSSSRTAVSNNGDGCETLPLPPPIESADLMNDIIVL